MLLVVTHQISERLRYVLHEIFAANHRMELGLVGIDEFIGWTELPDRFKSSEKTLFYLSSEYDTENQGLLSAQHLKLLAHTSSLWVVGSGLLEDQGLNSAWENPAVKLLSTDLLHLEKKDESLEIPVLFWNDRGSIGFDPFSMVFWLLSRYEEYFWYKKEVSKATEISLKYRFSGEISHAFNNNYLQNPLVDWVRIYLFSVLGYNQSQEIQLRKKPYRIIPTADIDLVFKFGKRTLIRALGSWLLTLKHPVLALERFKTLVSSRDPFNPLYQVVPFLKNHPTSKCFLLLSDKHNALHKQNDLDNPEVRTTLKTVCLELNSDTVGIHPSIELITSNNSNPLESWKKEFGELTRISSLQKTQSSRFHYLFFHLPNHYQELEKLGINEDWSMGYHDQLGFRASTSYSFNWYDLSQEKTTSLRIFPFQAMDVTCKNYLKLTPDLSNIYIHLIKQKIESVGGDFVFVFHNESLSESYPWKSWSKTINDWSNG